MRFIENIKYGVVFSLIAAGLNANAGATKISTASDWSLWESVNGDQTTCYIEAKGMSVINSSHGAEVSHFFRISKLKNSPNSPTELIIQLVKNIKNSTGLIASTEGAVAVPFASLEGSRTVFWAVSKSIANFTQAVGAKTYLKVLGVGGQKDYAVPFSASGYKSILAQMESRCNSGASLYSPQFEQEFLAQIPDSIDPTRLDITKTNNLRTTYFAAYKAFVDIADTKAQLAQLLARYQTFIDELAANRNSANQILNVQLPPVKSDLSEALNRQAEARAELAKIEALIPELNAKISRSQKVLDAAKAVVAPLQPEHDRILNNLTNAQSSLSSAQSRLSYIDGRLSAGAQQLSAIRSEANSIESWLPQRRIDVNYAYENYRTAQARRSQYNITREREYRLRNNFEYNRLFNDRNQMQNNLNQANSDTQRLRMERERVARELQQCRAGMTGETLATEAAHEPRPPGGGGNGGGGGLVPGPGHGDNGGGNGGGGLVPGPGHGDDNGGDGGHLQPTPTPDCSHLERALNIADSQVAQSQAAANNYANRINEINSRISQIERQVDWDVRQEYNFLVNREDECRREYERLDREVRNGEARVVQIRNTEIPNLENEQRSLTNERPTVVAAISDSQANVSRFTQELARFNAANNWDKKVAAVEAARLQLQNDQSALATVLVQKQSEQQKLDLNLSLAAQAQSKIDTLNAQLDVLNRRAVELNEALKNLPAERAPLDSKISAFEAVFANLKSNFLDLLK